MSFANFRIATKLLCGFGMILAMLIGVGATGLIQLQRVSAQTDELGERWLPSVYSIEEMRLAVATFRRQQYALQASTDAGAFEKFEEHMAKTIADLTASQKIYDPLPQTAEEKVAYDAFQVDWKGYLEMSQKWIELSRAAKKDEARELLTGGLYAAILKCDADLKTVADINNDGAVKAQALAHAIGTHAVVLIAIAVALATLAGVITALLLARSISRPVKALAAAVGQLAAGDLTAKVAVTSSDEVGTMAAAFNASLDSLQQVMTEIRSAADQTAASGEELSASAQNISSGAQTQASSVEEISASIQELSRSIDQVASGTGEANQIAHATSLTAEQGSQTVARSIEGMKAINDSSSQIAKIIGVINQIANQTNLLALNAAIEAASAGEHGLGFAVVADEVRKLAERSSTAAQEIAQLIDESGKRVDEGASLSQAVGKSLQAILDGITRTSAGMGGITTSATAQARTAKEVSTSIEGISAITEENSASAEEMAASAEELSAQAQRLQQLVARFTLDASASAPSAAVRPQRRQASGVHSANAA